MRQQRESPSKNKNNTIFQTILLWNDIRKIKVRRPLQLFFFCYFRNISVFEWVKRKDDTLYATTIYSFTTRTRHPRMLLTDIKTSSAC